MRITFCILILSLAYYCLPAQEVVRVDTISIPFSVVQDNRQWLATHFDSSAIRYSTDWVDLLQIRQLRLQDGDFIFDYELEKLKPKFFYDLRFQLLDEEGNRIPVLPHQVKGRRGKLDRNAFHRQDSISWWDVTEEHLYHGFNYQLQISQTLYGEGLDCASKPTFGIKEQWPFWIAGLVGGGLLGLGEGKRITAKKEYDRYRALWAGGAKKTQGIDKYADFDRQRRSHRNYTYAGIIVLAVDGIWYGLRLEKHLRKLNLYRKYCKLKVTTLPLDSNGISDVSLNLQFSF